METKDDSELNAQLETVTAEKQSILDQITVVDDETIQVKIRDTGVVIDGKLC